MKIEYYIAYEDKGPSGPCGQTFENTAPWRKLHIFENESDAREFIDKADLMDARNCNTNLKRDLIYWRELTINATADELNGLYSVANVLGRKNDREICGLWN